MGIGFSIDLIILGILGAANLIIAKRPDAKQMIDKIAPYGGWIGAGSTLWGIWIVIWGVMNMSFFLHFGMVVWLAMVIAGGSLLAILGLLMGSGILKGYAKSPEAQAKMDQTVAKLAPFQGTLGFISIGLGLFSLVYTLLGLHF
jgi:hypothetical protein